MITSVVLGFYFLMRRWEVELIILAKFQGSEMSPELFENFMDGCIEP